MATKPNIQDVGLVFKWNPGNRGSTNYITIHHVAGNGSVQTIHEGHKAKGWAGIGYHYYVRKSGDIYQGRPATWIGGHTQGYNSVGIGICFEGNFETDTMGDAQFKAGQQLLAWVKEQYPNAVVKPHRELNATACPGRNFPLERMNKEIELSEPETHTPEEVDDTPSEWAALACSHARLKGVIQGDDQGFFGYREPVTLERVLVILDRLGLFS